MSEAATGNDSGTPQEGATAAGASTGGDAATTGTGTATGGAQQTEAKTPPWGSDEDFDAGKAWKLIENLRSDVESAKGKVKEYEDAQLTEEQRRDAALKEAETTAATAQADLLRYEVAVDKGVPKELFDLLTGDSKEALEKNAARLVELAGKKGGTAPVTTQGNGSGSGPSDPDAWLREAARRS